MPNETKYNIAKEYSLYGFHRDKGPFPGIKLADKLRPIVQRAKIERQIVEVDLNDMRALYGSFFDGAFGLFIDEYKEDFFKMFVFQSEKKPQYLTVVNNVYNRHKDLNFNG